MIQPITLGGFKSESFSFRNSSSAAAIPAEIDKNANFGFYNCLISKHNFSFP